MKLTIQTKGVVANIWADLSRRFTGGVIKATARAANEIEIVSGMTVASAGKFGDFWIKGLRAKTIQGNGFNSEIELVSDIPFFSVFDKGVTIKGNPFLWLPLSFGAAAGQRVSDFKGQLFMVNRKIGGPPLLLSIETKQPLFVGLSQVQIQKKWDMKSVVIKVMQGFRAWIKNEMAR